MLLHLMLVNNLTDCMKSISTSHDDGLAGCVKIPLGSHLSWEEANIAAVN